MGFSYAWLLVSGPHGSLCRWTRNETVRAIIPRASGVRLRERPAVFLHRPWHGYFGRRDVVCLWDNAGRRELGLEGFDEVWSTHYRFAFRQPVIE